jgi:CheY-like chemotaxis protein
MPDHTPLIVLVDDDWDFLDVQRTILEEKGYRVACVSDPDDALASMSEERPDLVITDLMMRTLDAGFVLCRKIKENPRFSTIPVIIVTAIKSQRGFDFSPSLAGDLATMRADAYFEKPVAPEALLAKVAELLGIEEEDT